jgi:hypothetical protein
MDPPKTSWRNAWIAVEGGRGGGGGGWTTATAAAAAAEEEEGGDPNVAVEGKEGEAFEEGRCIDESNDDTIEIDPRWAVKTIG